MMSKIKLITIIFLIALFGCQNIKQMPVAIELENLQVLYEKLENPITYVYKGLNCKDLLLVCDTTKAKIVKSKYHNCEFTITPFEAWQEGLDILIYKKKIHPKNLLETINLKTLSIPKPSAFLVGKKSGTISKPYLRVAKQITIGFEYQNVTKSFDYILIDGSSKIVIDKGHVEGKLLPTSLQKKLLQLKEGDMIHFYNIVVTYHSNLGTTLANNDITLWVN